MVAIVKEIQVNGGDVVHDLSEVIELLAVEPWKVNFDIELNEGQRVNITIRQVSPGNVIAYGSMEGLGNFLAYAKEIGMTTPEGEPWSKGWRGERPAPVPDMPPLPNPEGEPRPGFSL